MSSPPSEDTFAPGDVVDDRFRIVRLIGKGGMGEVYEIERTSDGAHLALKTVLPELLPNPKIISRFERESAFSGRISHPGVLTIHEVFKISRSVAPSRDLSLGSDPADRQIEVSIPCMVMELLRGETLADRLVDGRLLDPDEAIPLVCQIAAALTAAHRAGIVHRDLKPDNIFLVPEDEGPRVVLTDFGVARKSTAKPGEESLTATNVLLGTPDYMAPEQLELEEAMPASDIYTLGLVMFEMLTGRAPFEADTPLKMVFKRVKEAPPSPRVYLPDLDERWEQVILRCLERQPEDRFAEAQDLIRILEGDSSPWLAPSFADRLRALVPWIAALVIVAAIVAAVISGA